MNPEFPEKFAVAKNYIDRRLILQSQIPDAIKSARDAAGSATLNALVGLVWVVLLAAGGWQLIYAFCLGSPALPPTTATKILAGGMTILLVGSQVHRVGAALRAAAVAHYICYCLTRRDRPAPSSWARNAWARRTA